MPSKPSDSLSAESFSQQTSAKNYEITFVPKAIHAQKCRQAARAKDEEVVTKLKALKLAKVAGNGHLGSV